MEQARTILLSESELRRYIYNKVLDDISCSNSPEYHCPQLISEGFNTTIWTKRFFEWLSKRLPEWLDGIMTAINKRAKAKIVGKCCYWVDKGTQDVRSYINTDTIPGMILDAVVLAIGWFVNKIATIITGKAISMATLSIITGRFSYIKRIPGIIKTIKKYLFGIKTTYRAAIDMALAGSTAVVGTIVKEIIMTLSSLGFCSLVMCWPKLANGLKEVRTAVTEIPWEIMKFAVECFGLRLGSLDTCIDNSKDHLEQFAEGIKGIISDAPRRTREALEGTGWKTVTIAGIKMKARPYTLFGVKGYWQEYRTNRIFLYYDGASGPGKTLGLIRKGWYMDCGVSRDKDGMYAYISNNKLYFYRYTNPKTKTFALYSYSNYSRKINGIGLVSEPINANHVSSIYFRPNKMYTVQQFSSLK